MSNLQSFQVLNLPTAIFPQSTQVRATKQLLIKNMAPWLCCPLIKMTACNCVKEVAFMWYVLY